MPRIRLYMAPMKGLTDHLFRSAFADHFGGFDLAVAPFEAAADSYLRFSASYLPEDLDALAELGSGFAAS